MAKKDYIYQGKLTYTAAAGIFVFAVLGLVLGFLTIEEAIPLFGLAFTAVGIRRAI